MAVAPDCILQPGHWLQCFINRVVACIVHRLFDAPDGDQRFGDSFVGALQRARQHRFSVFKHFVDQPACQRSDCTKLAAGMSQLF